MTRTLSLVFACLLAASSAAAQEAAPGDDLNPVVMRVDGEPVYAAEISMVMQNVQAQLQAQGQTVTAEEVVPIATQRVVEQKLLAAEARRFGLEPDPARVQQLLAAAERQAGGRQRLADNLAGGGSSLAQLEEMLTEMELARVYIERQIAPTVEVDEADVEAFYAAHPHLFSHDDVVRARQIGFAVPESADDDAVAAIRARAETARARALAGEDFAALAEEVSEDSTAERGGDLGWITRESIGPELGDAAFTLGAGGISPVLRTTWGFHVLTVEEVRPAGILPLEEVRGKAITLTRQDAIAQTVRELLETLTRSAQIETVGVSAPTAVE
jgi:parvulin-like peptidyl-prolyl isomerase